MRYQIRGLSAAGAIQNLSIDAADADDATRQAQAQGLRVLSLAAAQSWFSKSGENRKKFPLLQFNQELLALLNAGINLIEAIQTLLEKEERPDTKRVLSDLNTCLCEGLPLSVALERQPAVFPPLYCATAQASERIGGLPEALKRYIAYQSQIEVVRKKLVSAAIYPAVLIVVATLVLAFLLGYVVPRFSAIYADMGDDLPWLSKVLMTWGQFLEQHAGLALGSLVAVAVLFWWWLRKPATQQALGSLLWRIPAVGRRVRVYQLARFYRTLGMLLRGGMAVVPSMRMVAGLLHQGMRAPLDLATNAIRDGQSISESMQAHGLVTPVALRMLRVGERTGQMGDMMEKIAEFHDEEMERWVDMFSRLLEPILMTIIGVVIGGVVLLMYLPIFDLAGNIK
jgi:general secretion pathway protein F